MSIIKDKQACIHLKVRENQIEVLRKNFVYQDTEDMCIAYFDFDDSWDEYLRLAVFKVDNIEIKVLIDPEGYCVIPRDVLLDSLSNGFIEIGVFGINGDKRITTNFCLGAYLKKNRIDNAINIKNELINSKLIRSFCNDIISEQKKSKKRDISKNTIQKLIKEIMQINTSFGID